MISKVLPHTPCFNGVCKIGRDDEEKRRISKAINTMPKQGQGELIDSINILKKSIEANTPKDERFVIGVNEYNSKNDFSGLTLNVRSGSGGIKLSEQNIQKTIVGCNLEFYELRDQIKSACTAVFCETIDAIKPKSDLPKNQEEIFDRLA